MSVRFAVRRVAYVRAGRDCGLVRMEVGGKVRVRRGGEVDWISGFGSTCGGVDARDRVRSERREGRRRIMVVVVVMRSELEVVASEEG